MNSPSSSAGSVPTQGGRRTRRAAAFSSALAGISLAAALGGAPAYAALGEGAASVESDRVQVHASVRQVSHPAYTVHELTNGMNGLVREYLSPAGQVFAVSWHGPTMPNLQQILGIHFAKLASVQHQPGVRSHLAVQTNNLVFESSGHVRSFHGRAYLADALPAGVTTDEIQ